MSAKPALSFADAVRTRQAHRHRKTCDVSKALAVLSDAEGKELLALIADPAVEMRAISDELAARGVKVLPTTLGRHRRGQCTNCG